MRTVQRLKPTQLHSHIGLIVITGVHRTDTHAVTPDRRGDTEICPSLDPEQSEAKASRSTQVVEARDSGMMDMAETRDSGMMDMAELRSAQTGQETAQNPS